jgi:hypothetical protein
MIAQELVVKPVRIKLDKWRTLSYSYEAHAALQKVTGRNMLEPEAWEQIIEEVSKKFNPVMLLQVIWAGLVSEDESLSMEDVKRLIRGKSHVLLQTKFLKALTASIVQANREMQEDEAEESENPPQDNHES